MWCTRSWKCSVIQPSLLHLHFLVIHEKPHGVRGLIKDYHMQLEPKLVHGICAIRQTPCECSGFKYVFGKTWYSGVSPSNQPFYKILHYYTYWTVLGSFNDWYIITSTNKNKTSNELEAINKVVLDRISDNMTFLVQSSKYDDNNTIYY